MSVLEAVLTKRAPAVGWKAPDSALLDYLLDYLQRPESGGLPGLIQKFEGAGFGPNIHSWIGEGPRLLITPRELRQAFGCEGVSQIADATGLSPAHVIQHLAEMLPPIVHHLTPGGTMPEPAKLGELGEEFRTAFNL